MQRVRGNLFRQQRALELLCMLLEEEFSHLREGRPQSVVQVEFSIQELMRQLADERLDLRRALTSLNPNAQRVRQILSGLGAEDAAGLEALLAEMDRLEQAAARQAAKNHHLVMALAEQSRSLLEFMHRQIQPKTENGYSAKGRMAAAPAQPAMVSGRL